MRIVRQIMGLPISIDIPDAKTAADFEPAFKRFEQIDHRFSTYKPDSEVSRYIKGEITENDLSGELKYVIERCHEAEQKTDGYFSAWAGGKFDPSGYVKGWAIAEAAKELERQGIKTYCIGAGGDILARSNTDKVWNIGIQSPADKAEILNKLSISNGAIATSGNYERGAHIINPKTNKPPDGLVSVTVVGPDIIWADVLATAIFARGSQAADFMAKQPGYELFVVKKLN
ncbi:FAD:protein FMN transferase [Candidatus Saccharibacteria bacterium]|nr:FAD:protein FMN transferase [Candidatus Saccharibacteria bacterium]